MAQDTFRFPLKRESKKNLLPSAMAAGLSAKALDGSFGRAGREPIHKERMTEISF